MPSSDGLGTRGFLPSVPTPLPPLTSLLFFLKAHSLFFRSLAGQGICSRRGREGEDSEVFCSSFDPLSSPRVCFKATSMHSGRCTLMSYNNTSP